jgi:hypothetical protein
MFCDIVPYGRAVFTSPTPVWSLTRSICGVEYALCEETQKVGLYASVFHFDHQAQTIHFFHCPTSPLYFILVDRPRDITTE